MAIQKIAIIGAGIFGCSIALELEREGYEIILFEKEDDILQLATKNNHNRIHYGYHYPRSLETVKQSLDGLLSFLTKYSDAILFGFENYYSIAKENSLTNATQFKEFCKEAGIGYKSKFPSKYIMNNDLLEDSFLVEEPIYDWTKLQSIIKTKIYTSNIKVKLKSDFTQSSESFDFVINCTYSNINKICEYMKLPVQKFRMQDVLIPIFESKVDRIGLTVMDGPFCSVMPKGFEKDTFLLYHAKYSIIEEKIDGKLLKNADLTKCTAQIINDSIKYFPFLNNANFNQYWRTNRAIPINNNDQRLSEIITYKENPNFITIFSGKVTTSVKIAKQIKLGLSTGYFNSHIYL
jgi:hypothetical protein